MKWRLLCEDEGNNLVEYALLLALLVLASIVAIASGGVALGGNIGPSGGNTGLYQAVANHVNKALQSLH